MKKVLVILFTMILSIVLIVPFYFYIDLIMVHAEITHQAHEYKPYRIEKEPYTLGVIVKEMDGIPYASFQVLKNNAETIFVCDQSFRTMDLKDISWDKTSYDIIVTSGDIGEVKYLFVGSTWEKFEK